MAPAPNARRVLLGTRRGFMRQQRTYRAADYLEIDNIEGHEVRRRRIFYDEILMVTFHSALGWAAIVMTGMVAAFFGLLGLAVHGASRLAAGIVFAAVCIPLMVFLILRSVMPDEVVTVFGKRTRTQMRFWTRTARPREIYGLICRLAREHQARVARQSASESVTTPTEPAVPPA
jgi:predicted alpha/beta hydrolase